MEVYFIEFCVAALFITMGLFAVTAIIRPRVFKVAFEYQRPSFILPMLCVAHLFLNHAVLAGLLNPLAMCIVPLLLIPHFWIAIVRVWARKDPTDRWLFHVPQVPESLRGKRSIQ